MSKITHGQGKKINLNTWCGTIEYIAPEIFTAEGYGKECDIWSIGVIAYFILSRIPPFLGTDEEIEHLICTCNYSYSHPIWKTISKQAQAWIDAILELDPKDRMTAEDSINHDWLSNKEGNRVNYKIHRSVMMSLRVCNKPQDLHYLMLVVFCQFLNDDDEMKAIKETFQSMDADMSGSVEVDELRKAFQILNLQQSSVVVDDIQKSTYMKQVSNISKGSNNSH